MSLQRIPAGRFRIGARGFGRNEEPPHVVELTAAFFLGTFPVTQAEFGVWTAEAGMYHANHFRDKPDHPAESLDWDQAMRFCAWLTVTRADQLPEGHMATLPTEAQWESACRAGTETEYYTGDGQAALAEAAWFGEEWETGSTHPVRTKRPNDFGLYGMHGNVWEWCRDAFDVDAYKKRVDGTADPEVRAEDVKEENLHRVIRGGSWVDTGGFCRSACRLRRGLDHRVRDLGFRVCLVAGQRSRSAPRIGESRLDRPVRSFEGV